MVWKSWAPSLIAAGSVTLLVVGGGTREPASALGSTVPEAWRTARARHLGEGGGIIAGRVQPAGRAATWGRVVRLRRAGSSTVLAETQTAAGGGFAFEQIPGGLYALDVIDAAGRSVGTGAFAMMAGELLEVAIDEERPAAMHAGGDDAVVTGGLRVTGSAESGRPASPER